MVKCRVNKDSLSHFAIENKKPPLQSNENDRKECLSKKF